MKQDFTPNEEQRRAISEIDGPMLVLAGPGTGKTQLLSARVAEILDKTDTPASAILCLTFTDSGAQAMRNRLTRFIKDQAYQVEINTYHGFAQTIIGQYRDYFLEQNLEKVVDFITQYNFVRELLDELEQNNILKKIKPQDIISTIGELKQAMISPEKLLELADENQTQIELVNPGITRLTQNMKRMPGIRQALPLFTEIYQILAKHQISKSVLAGFPGLLEIAGQKLQLALSEAEETNSTKPLTKWKDDFLEKNRNDELVFKDNFNDIRLRTLQKIYAKYNQKMKAGAWYDFNDMILATIETIEKNPELKFNLQEKYLYILLDEYQDTNRAQSRLIELLTDNPVHEGRPNIMAVGDDDQAIYAFQGALFSNMLDFYQTYRNTKLINLTKNYRSHQDILSSARQVADQIEDRLSNRLDNSVNKILEAANPKITECAIERLDFPNPLAEYTAVAKKIQTLKNQGEDLNEIAVLAPKHVFLEQLAPYLSQAGLAVRYEKSENVLDNPGLKLLLNLARLVDAIAKQQSHNDLIMAVLSSPIWQLDTPTLWNLAWQADRRHSWLDFIIKQQDFKDLQPIALWLMEFAKISSEVSLEANFDYLIGNAALTYRLEGQEFSFRSPLRDFFQAADAKKLLNFVLDVNLLRSNFIEYSRNHPKDKRSALEKLLSLVESYEAAEEKMSRTNSYSEASAAVNLMTAFGAKGLEFKHVFLLETNNDTWGKSRPNSNRIALPVNLQPIRHDRETIDEKARLLFVAMTRAKSHLYLMNSLANLKGKAKKRLEFFQEIEQDGGWCSEILPKAYQQIKAETSQAELEQLDNNLFDNFGAWQERHLEATHDFADLLAPRLDKYKLSATGFNNYTDLVYSGPKAYFIDNVLGFPGSYSPHAVYGTAVHFALERLQHSQVTISGDLALKFFQQKLNEFDLSEADFLKLSERASYALPKFVQARSELFQPSDNLEIRTEENFYSSHVVLNNARLTGTIDRLEICKKTKTITIVDFKTGKSFDKLNLNEPSLYHHYKQLYFYQLMLTASERFPGFQVKNWRLEFVEPDCQGEINYLEGEFEASDLERIKRLIQVIWQKTMNLDFSKPTKTPGKSFTLADIKHFEVSLLENNDA